MLLKRKGIVSIIAIAITTFFCIGLLNCNKDINTTDQDNGLNQDPHRGNGDNDSYSNPLAWTIEETDSILHDAANTTMRVFKIHNYSDSIVLRTQSIDVVPDSTDTILTTLIDRMYYTVTDSAQTGVGIAAPQVGINRNIIWVKRIDKVGKPYEYYLNPEIIQVTATEYDQAEGCLSIDDPDYGIVRRYYGIYFKHVKMDGVDTTELITEYTARIFQHEIDHLNGILYIDYMDTLKSLKIHGHYDIINTMENNTDINE